MTTTDSEESEAERAAQSLLRTQEDLCDDPQNIAAYVLCEVGAEIVRALGRIERELREARESQGICGHGATGICMNCLAQALNR